MTIYLKISSEAKGAKSTGDLIYNNLKFIEQNMGKRQAEQGEQRLRRVDQNTYDRHQRNFPNVFMLDLALRATKQNQYDLYLKIEKGQEPGDNKNTYIITDAVSILGAENNYFLEIQARPIQPAIKPAMGAAPKP